MKQLKVVEKMKDKWISLDNWEANGNWKSG
jgi:hypothetical protein